MTDLTGHQPSEDARRRAQAAGVDLERARVEDPNTYMMLCSAPLLYAHGALRGPVTEVLERQFAGKQIFEAKPGSYSLFLGFPEPTQEDLARLDRSLFELAGRLRGVNAYYRVVEDSRGERREFAVPAAPDEWTDEEVLVGPFENQAQAREWGLKRVDGSLGFTFDTLSQDGYWYCDVFRGEIG